MSQHSPLVYLSGGTSVPAETLTDYSIVGSTSCRTGTTTRPPELPSLDIPAVSFGRRSLASGAPFHSAASSDAAAAFPHGPRRVVFTQSDASRFSRILNAGDLVFASNFESGNLAVAQRVTTASVVSRRPSSVRAGAAAASHPSLVENKQEYELFMAADVHSAAHRQWFMFTVSNMSTQARYTFHVVNHVKRSSMFGEGMCPLMYSAAQQQATGCGWSRVGEDDQVQGAIEYYKAPPVEDSGGGGTQVGGRRGYVLTWHVNFPHERDTVLFCMCWPYSVSMHQLHLAALQDAHSQMLRCRVLCHSLAGTPIHLLCVAEHSRSCVPVSRRQAIVFSARVHPGESNASWVMRGVLETLMGGSLEARWLRSRYAVYVVPMLNPDGVVNGNTRTSLAGVDLNRRWDAPHPVLHPGIYHLKTTLQRLHKVQGVALFTDFHGHTRKQGVFLYGCTDVVPAWSAVPQAHIEGDAAPPSRSQRAPHSSAAAGWWKWPVQQLALLPRVLPGLLARRAPHLFTYAGSTFRVGQDKLTTARAVASQDIGIPLAYTCEASFAGFNGRHFHAADFQAVGAEYVTGAARLLKAASQLAAAAAVNSAAAEQGSVGGSGKDSAEHLLTVPALLSRLGLQKGDMSRRGSASAQSAALAAAAATGGGASGAGTDRPALSLAELPAYASPFVISARAPHDARLGGGGVASPDRVPSPSAFVGSALNSPPPTPPQGGAGTWYTPHTSPQHVQRETEALLAVHANAAAAAQKRWGVPAAASDAVTTALSSAPSAVALHINSGGVRGAAPLPASPVHSPTPSGGARTRGGGPIKSTPFRSPLRAPGRTTWLDSVLAEAAKRGGGDGQAAAEAVAARVAARQAREAQAAVQAALGTTAADREKGYDSGGSDDEPEQAVDMVALSKLLSNTEVAQVAASMKVAKFTSSGAPAVVDSDTGNDVKGGKRGSASAHRGPGPKSHFQQKHPARTHTRSASAKHNKSGGGSRRRRQAQARGVTGGGGTPTPTHTPEHKAVSQQRQHTPVRISATDASSPLARPGRQAAGGVRQHLGAPRSAELRSDALRSFMGSPPRTAVMHGQSMHGVQASPLAAAAGDGWRERGGNLTTVRTLQLQLPTAGGLPGVTQVNASLSTGHTSGRPVSDAVLRQHMQLARASGARSRSRGAWGAKSTSTAARHANRNKTPFV